MDHIEDKVELRHGADQLGFQEGRPLLLQGALPPEVTLTGRGSLGKQRWERLVFNVTRKKMQRKKNTKVEKRM